MKPISKETPGGQYGYPSVAGRGGVGKVLPEGFAVGGIGGGAEAWRALRSCSHSAHSTGDLSGEMQSEQSAFPQFEQYAAAAASV